MGRSGLSLVVSLLGITGGIAACDQKEPDDGESAGSGKAEAGDVEDVDGDPDDEPDPDDDSDGAPDGVPQPPPESRPDAAVLCDEVDGWMGTVCEAEGGAGGVSYCIVVDGQQIDTPCSADPGNCTPGDNLDQGCLGSICIWNGAAFETYSWSEPNCNTPLVVELEGPTSFMPATATSFDLSSDGSCQSTDWPTSPWLALDRDGDGVIRSGAELFGNATKMSTGGYAEHGFAALAELDDNRDGKISEADAAFASLVLWSDLDDDRQGVSSELRSLADVSLVAIDLGFSRRASCDGHGNCGNERAAFEYRTPEGATAIGEVVDVYLECR